MNVGGIIDFCHDSNGDLYVHYCDNIGDETIGGSKLFLLNQNGSVEETILDDKDIVSIGVREEIESNKNVKDGEMMTIGKGRASIYKAVMTENNEIALTYILPVEFEHPKLILHNPYTGEKTFETDYFGSDLEQFVIHNGNLIYYKVPLANKAPTLDTAELKQVSL
jgi:hypothetical protein